MIMDSNSPGATTQVSSRVAIRISAALPPLLLPEGTVCQVAIAPVLAPVPNCQPWFRGVYGLRGTLVPVFDVAAASGKDLIELRNCTLLVIDPDRKPVGLVCTQAPEVVIGMACEPQAVPEELTSLSAHLGAPMAAGDRHLFEFSIQSWIATAARKLIRGT